MEQRRDVDSCVLETKPPDKITTNYFETRMQKAEMFLFLLLSFYAVLKGF